MRWSLVVLACLPAVGCGGRSELKPADRAQARATLAAYADAMVARRGEQACATLTRAMRARHEAAPGPGCPHRIEVHARAAGLASPVQTDLPAELSDDGSVRAIVLYASGAGTSGGEVTLRREGGRWLIDRDLSCITPSCDP